MGREARAARRGDRISIRNKKETVDDTKNDNTTDNIPATSISKGRTSRANRRQQNKPGARSIEQPANINVDIENVLPPAHELSAESNMSSSKPEASAEPNMSSSEPEAFEAQLAVEEDDEYRYKAEKEAEQNYLATVTEAEPYAGDKESVSSKRRNNIICGLVALVLLTVGAVVGVVVGLSGGDDAPVEPGPPTFAPVTLLSELSQEFCDDAVEIHSDAAATTSLAGSTFEATVDDDANFEPCGTLTDNGAGVWYFLEGAGKIMSVSTCGIRTNFDTQISIYSGNGCNVLKCVEANDQRAACSSPDGSQSFFFADQGTRYYILVHGKRRSSGIFSLSMEEELNNDQCISATRFDDFERASSTDTVSLFGSTKFSALDDTISIEGCENVQVTAPGVWFVFQAEEDRFVQARVDDFSTRVSIFSGDDCSSLRCVTASDIGRAMWTTKQGTDYFIFVHGVGKDVGDFSLTLLPGGLLAPDPDAPTNIQCNLASPLSNDGSVTGSTESGQVFSDVGSCGNLVRITAKGIWYSVIGTGRGMLASTCETTSHFDTQISVFTGECTNLECVDGGDQNCGDYSAVAWYSKAGTPYYILVHGADGRVGEFKLTLQEVEPTSNAQCTVPLPVSLDGVAILGTTEGAEFQDVGLCQGLDVKSPSVWYTVVGTGTTLIASTCDAFSDTVAQVEVFGGSCSDWECLDTTEVSCGDQMTLSWTSEVDKIYTIQVYGPGAFTLSVEEVAENHVCLGASEDLQIGTTLFGSTRITRPEDAIGCETVTPGEPGSWYRVVAEADDILTLSACSDFTNFKTDLRVFAGNDCGNLACVAANNGMSCGVGSSISWEASANVVYYVLVQGSGQDEFENFALQLGTENNLCETASLIRADGVVYRGSTVGATMDSSSLACFDSGTFIAGPSVWYALAGSGSLLMATTCSTQTDFDTQLSIYRGNSCEQLSCIAGNDNDCGLQSSVSWFAEEGVVYYILVHGYSPGSFGLVVSEIENETCSSSQTLPLDGTSTQGVLSNSGTSVGYFDPCTSRNIDTPGSWYSVRGTGTEMTIDVCATWSMLSQVSVLGSDCNALTCLDYSQNDCVVTLVSLFGEEYHVVVSDGASRKIELTVEASNDQCESAFGPLSLGDEVRGSNVQANGDSVAECGDASNRGAGVWYSFLGEGQPVTVFTCSEFTNFDTQLSIYTGEDCSKLSCVDGRDNNCGTQSWITISAADGQIYYVLVSGKGVNTGDFVLRVL